MKLLINRLCLGPYPSVKSLHSRHNINLTTLIFMKKNKLLMLLTPALLWLGGQSASAITLTAVAGDHWDSNESPVQLVDGKQGTKWGNGGAGPHTAILKSDLPLSPTAYVLRIANDTNTNTGRNWKSWKIYGGNFASDEEAKADGAAWNLIDTQTDVQLSTDQYAECPITVSGEDKSFYTYFKIIVEQLVNPGDYMQMDEFWFSEYTVDTSAFDEQIAKCKDFDLTATGHYAQTEVIDGKTWLATSPDPVKDQTDFLCQIDSLQVSKLMFPIGHLWKHEVRAIAEREHLLQSLHTFRLPGRLLRGQVQRSLL